MSVQTWLDEFGTKTDLEKWIGLRKENLEKHGCFLNGSRRLEDKEVNKLYINGRTCQLCRDYYNDTGKCENCPLDKDGNGCDNYESPWEIWIRTGNPEPMIQALTRISGELPQRTEKVNYIEEGKKNLT